jgi:ribonuclease G
VRMNPHVSSQFTGNGARVLHQLEADTGKHFHFTGSEGLPLDHFDVVLEGSDEDVREEAIPFREGDEVLVKIVEPHMYNVDDAVAKVDGYIISVAGGGVHVGEKRLVRIEEAGRTSATAVLVDDRRGSPNGATADPKPAARKRVQAKSADGKGKSKAKAVKPAEAEGPAEAEEATDDAGASDDDALESTPRRRGRRGGRRRSAAKAEATSD